VHIWVHYIGAHMLQICVHAYDNLYSVYMWTYVLHVDMLQLSVYVFDNLCSMYIYGHVNNCNCRFVFTLVITCAVLAYASIC